MIPIILGGNKQYADALQQLAQAEKRLADAEEQLLEYAPEIFAMLDELVRDRLNETPNGVPPPLPKMPVKK